MTIKRGWVSFGLGRFRDTGFATYAGGPTDQLPALPDGDRHAWMAGLAALGGSADGQYGFDTLGGEVHTAAHPAALPAEFVAFMADPLLRESVPTCTACYWEPALPVAPSPVEPGATLVRFLNDQQGCLFWYLHLRPDGGHEVVCGSYAYDEETVDAADAEQDLLIVGAGFDDFIARFWIENLAWYEVVGQDRTDDELSAPVRAYVTQL